MVSKRNKIHKWWDSKRDLTSYEQQHTQGYMQCQWYVCSVWNNRRGNTKYSGEFIGVYMFRYTTDTFVVKEGIVGLYNVSSTTGALLCKVLQNVWMRLQLHIQNLRATCLTSTKVANQRQKRSNPPRLVKPFCLCLSTSIVPSCWKYAYVQSVPKKGNRSNPSNYRPIVLLSCLFKAFEKIRNRKVLKYLSSSNLVSVRQYGFRKGRSAGDLLAFFTDSWSPSLSCFGENFAVALNISKAFDRVLDKSLLSKLPSYEFYPSLCTFLSSFFSGRSISAVVDGHCSKPKSINSGVPQGSVLSPTLFLLFVSDLSKTNCPIHS